MLANQINDTPLDFTSNVIASRMGMSTTLTTLNHLLNGFSDVHSFMHWDDNWIVTCLKNK